MLFAAALLAASAAAGCSGAGRPADPAEPQFVTTDGRGFRIGDSAYRYMGTNFWYGPILASEGQGGDRRRLHAELDTLQSLGLENLRILVGGDGAEPTEVQIRPTLQLAPGVYNDTLLRGLDYLLAELERRGMHAVLYLNNAWEWSGGFGTYLEWAGHGKAPMPKADGYQAYMTYVSHFAQCDTAKAMFYNHVRNIVGRTNSITGRPYAGSPAIMSWQIANEPRPFSQATKEAMLQWIDSTARIIKSIDPNHLVSTGSEGSWGFERDADLWRRVNELPSVDYANIHIWPYNWGWIADSTVVSGLPGAIANTADYIAGHAAIMESVGKPMVLEEFGYPRDGMSFDSASTTRGRDGYYTYIISQLAEGGPLAGANFWGWGGLARPAHESWMPGDDYTGDPAQEPQGLNSVFAGDESTIAVIRSN